MCETLVVRKHPLKEQGDEAGFTHPSQTMDQEFVIAVQNVVILKGSSLHDIAGICKISVRGFCVLIILTCQCTLFPMHRVKIQISCL